MRVSFLQIATVLIFSFSSYADGTRAQSVLNKPVTLSVEQEEIKKVFAILRKQTGVKFTYSTNVIDVHRKISCSFRNTRLRDVLEFVLNPLKIEYQLVDEEQIVLSAGSLIGFHSVPAVQIGMERTEAMIEETLIDGTVTDEKANPLPGVTVTEKGTNNTTTTNDMGNFRLRIKSESSVIGFSFVGYTNQEVVAGKTRSFNIVLNAAVSELNDVVVIGYGQVRKRDLTGSVSKVTSKNISATPIVALDRAMQGRAAGVSVITNSARPGGGTTIRIRGTGSINASNEPLYVIDGFPTSDLNSINTNDIESIEILKDASATAIYGSRGTNGVVMVTTKKGKAGKAILAYDGYYGMQQVRRTIPMLNAQEFALLVNEARVNAGSPLWFDGSTADKPLPETLAEGTDWQQEVLRDAPIQNHQLSISGGNEKTRYAISGSYYGQQGIILNSNFNRYTLRANLDADISKKLKIGFTMQSAYTTGRNARTEVDGNTGGGVISSALSFSPTFPLYKPDGIYYTNLGSLNGLSVDNPLAIANEISTYNKVIRVLANTYLEYKIIEGLSFRTSFGADLQNFKSNFYATRLSQLGSTSNGSGSVSSNQNISWLTENTLNYNKKFGSNHNFSALVGFTSQAWERESVTASGRGFNNDFATYNNLGAGATLVAPATGASETSLISYLARLNYIYDDRFLLTLSGRADGSSRFGPENKYGYFPSGAFAWKLSEESFMQRYNFLSDAKLRISYGLGGNQEIGDYQYIASITNNGYVLANMLNTGSTIGSVGNPGLKWEKSAQFDIGVDVGLLGNRFQFTADYYDKTTSDLLFNVNIPVTSGFSTALQNIGKIQNKGFEFSFNSVNIDSKNFQWSTEFNITFNENKILNLEGRDEFTTGSDAQLFAISLNPILLKVGQPLGQFYGRVVDGIFQNTQEIANSAQTTAKPGDIKYRDLNGDKVINDNDRTVIGNSNPKFFGGLNNTFTYRNFDLNIFIQGSYGNDLLNFSRFDVFSLTGGNNNSAEVLKRWTPTNPSNSIPRANLSGGARILSSFQVEDGSYLRFKNISLGYNFSSGLLKKIGMIGAKIYVSGQNLITITDYSGYDPEVNRYGSSSLSQGIDYGAYPQAKTILAGVNLKF